MKNMLSSFSQISPWNANFVSTVSVFIETQPKFESVWRGTIIYLQNLRSLRHLLFHKKVPPRWPAKFTSSTATGNVWNIFNNHIIMKSQNKIAGLFGNPNGIYFGLEKDYQVT